MFNSLCAGRRLQHDAALGGPTRRAFLMATGMSSAVAATGCGASDIAEVNAGPSQTPTSRPKPTVRPTDPPLKIVPDVTYAVGDPLAVPYGQHSSRQYGELIVPQGLPENIKVPVIMLLHGGSWKNSSTLDYMRGIAQNMAAHGIVTWNVEYRGIGGGGGWPNTFADVAAAMDHVPALAENIGRTIDRKRFVVSGHSAGGHLAAWAASRHTRGAEQPGGRPVLRPAACVTFAGVYDLAFAHHSGHRRMVTLLGGTPEQIPERYELASPIHNIPQDVHFVCCHGSDDSVVPVSQLYNYAARGEGVGNQVETVVLTNGDHLDWGDPTTYAYGVGQQTLLESVMAVDIA
ncbi:MAG: alpha/beta fold hydrolase [Kocuria sp.]|nr:alpha/beta fold hydrolase [Kocuria sp.]